MINSGVHVVGHWEYGYLTPLPEHYMWALPLRDYEVPNWWMSPVSGVKNTEYSKVNLNEREQYSDIFNDIDSTLPRIFLEPRTDDVNPDTIWLRDFSHPESCVYVFGSAHYNPTISHKRDSDLVVTIESVRNDGVLWSNQCLVVLLYDRLLKSGTLV